MTDPLQQIVDAIHEYRNNHSNTPSVIYIGPELLDELKNMTEMRERGNADVSEIRVAGANVREQPSLEGIRIPVDEPGLEDFYYP